MIIDAETGEWAYDEAEMVALNVTIFPAWNMNPSGPFFIVNQRNGQVGPALRCGKLEQALRRFAEECLPIDRFAECIAIRDSRGHIVLGYASEAVGGPRWFGCGIAFTEASRQKIAPPEDIAMWELSARGEFDDLGASVARQ